MRKFTKSISALAFFGAVLLFTSCKDDSYLLDQKPFIDASFEESFDDYGNAIANGWRVINRSVPVGPSNWVLGSPNFTAYSSNIANNGCFYSDFDASGSLPTTSVSKAVINNWLISKPVFIKNGDQIIFYTRTSNQAAGAEYPDCLQVRVNTFSDGIEIGRINLFNPTPPVSFVDNFGNFSTILLSINPSLALNGPNSYPRFWTKFVCTVDGLPKPLVSRFAFRHFTLNGGPSNPNGTDIAIDQVSFISKK